MSLGSSDGYNGNRRLPVDKRICSFVGGHVEMSGSKCRSLRRGGGGLGQRALVKEGTATALGKGCVCSERGFTCLRRRQPQRLQAQADYRHGECWRFHVEELVDAWLSHAHAMTACVTVRSAASWRASGAWRAPALVTCIYAARVFSPFLNDARGHTRYGRWTAIT